MQEGVTDAERIAKVSQLNQKLRDDDEAYIQNEWRATFHDEAYSEDFHVVEEFWWCWYVFVKSIFGSLWYLTCSCLCCCGRKPQVADSNEAETPAVEYEFIWFNAWLYNGTDNLWAALILKLFEGVEKHYGTQYKFAQRRALLWSLAVKMILTSIPLFAAYFAGEDIRGKLGRRLELLGISAMCLPAISLLGALYKNWVASLSQSSNLLQQANNSNLRSQLGFMDVVKSKLFEIGELLLHPLAVPTVWDFFLSRRWLPSSLYNRITAYHRRKAYAKHLPCRFVIFVDDLDRCNPDKCIEVLASINLMCESLPFIIFLAIDPRVVVSSIEAANEGFYGQVGISGYSYLDKIVQLPFAIPELCTNEKKAMLRGYLTGKGAATRDYSLICQFDSVYQCGAGTYPEGVGFQNGKLFWGGFRGKGQLVDPDSFEVQQDISLIDDLQVEMKRVTTECAQMVANQNGDIFVTNTARDVVVQYNAKFRLVKTIQAGLFRPHGVAATTQCVYIADSGNNRIVVYNLDMDKATDTIASKGNGDGHLENPTGLCLIGKRALAVADRGNNRIQLFNLDGSHIRSIGTGKLGSPNDVQTDPDGHLLVYDTKNCRIVLFAENGQYITSIMQGFFLDNGNTFSWIACCPETGRIAVSDNDNHRIALLRPYLY